MDKEEIKSIKYTENKSRNKNNVYQYDLNLNLIKVWDSPSECYKNGFPNVYSFYKKIMKYKNYIWSDIPIHEIKAR